MKIRSRQVLFSCTLILATLIHGGTSARSDTFRVDFSPYRELDGRSVRVSVEFTICALAVFLGALRICHNNTILAYGLYFVFSAYLLWATFYRQYYLHHTPVADIDAIKSERSLRKGYLFVSMASWISSLFLECTSSARFLNLLKRIFSGEYRVRWSCGMIAAVAATTVCTLNSLYLTRKLQEEVRLSLRYVSSDISVLGFLYVANTMRCVRQFTEGLTFITGIVTKWQDRTSKMLFGCIALTSFVLLFHHSILIYSFVTQKSHVWGVQHCFDLLALSVDVLFRLCVCLWATRNSCCFADRLHLDLEADIHHAQVEIVAPSISNTAHLTHHNQFHSHNWCQELAIQHLNRTRVQQLPFPQPFPPPSNEINQPPIESTVGVGDPFPLKNLETHPQSESGYLSTSSTTTGRTEHLSSKTLLDTKAELVPPSNINVPS